MLRLYSKSETNFNHNGLKILQPIEATVFEEINGDYSLRIVMPPGVTEIEVEQIIKVPTPKSEQLFRVFSADVDMLGNQIFYCRHIFYDLLDYFIEDSRPTGSGALAITKILEGTPFSGVSDITNQGTAYYQMMSPVKAILGADNAFIKVWGGEIERDNFKISMKNRLGDDRGVSIRYRKNLTGMRLVTDLSLVCTKIMPTGLKSDGQTLLFLPEKYVTSPFVDNYSNIKTTRIHYSDIKISDEITETQALQALRNAANLEFENGVDKPFVTASVEFLPLQNTEEYKNFAILESVYLGDTVKIFHEKLDIELSARVVSYEFDALSKRYKNVIIGNVEPKFGESQRKYIEQVKAETTTTLEQAIINATQLITGNQGGHVVLNPAEKPQEILILDTDSVQTAQKVWRWNLSGLGYSSTGVNGPFALAMTMNGAIVADFITAGIINGALIKAGSVQAGSLSQDYKNSVTNDITGAENRVTQAFKVADGQVLSTVNNTLNNYSTTTQMNSAITQSANSINTSVSATYLSKTAAASTYATQSSLTQTADSINLEVSKKVNNTEFGTKITQNSSSVQIAWNTISQVIQFISAALRIYDSSGADKKLLMQLGSSGMGFYRDDVYVGLIGTNRWGSDSTKKGLVFDLDGGHYMCWANREGSSYITKLSFYNTSALNSVGLHLGATFYLNGYYTYIGGSVRLQRWSNGAGIGGVGYGDSTFDVVGTDNSRITSCDPGGINFYKNLYMWNWKIYDTSIQSSSDARLKKDIADCQISGLETINALECKEFKWKKDDKFEEIGFIAQQVGRVNKNFIGQKKDGEETFYTLDQMAMIPYLVKSVQELSSKVEVLEQKVATLNGEKLTQKMARTQALSTFSESDDFDIEESGEVAYCEPVPPEEMGFIDLGDGTVEFFKREGKPDDDAENQA